ncbi:MAG: hypothetical protein AAGN35_28270 [Bacteroidota bacterium]
MVLLSLAGCRNEEPMGCDLALPLAVEVPCAASVSDLQALERGAMQMALREIREQGGPAADSVRIAEANWRPYAEALAAVRTAIPQMECQDLSALLSVEPFQRVAMDELLLHVDAREPWVQAWVNLNSMTGNPEVDALMNRYNLTVTAYYDWEAGDHVVVASSEPLQLLPLLKKFRDIEGIVDGYENTLVGDGDDIMGLREGNDMLIRIYDSYGDCPSGCQHDDIWTFRVTPGCRVFYEGFHSN